MKYIVLFFFLSTVSVFAQDIEEMKVDIEYLADDMLEGREVGTDGEMLAAGYISFRYKQLGLTTTGELKSYLQHFSVNQKLNPHADLSETNKKEVHGMNVVGVLDNQSEYTVVLGAHYDHLGYGQNGGSLHAGQAEIHNGADDNASGIAAMLQIAENLAEKEDLNYNYVFIAFSGEEKGLWGSNYFTKTELIPNSTVNYMFNLDMVGRLNEENRLAVSGVGTSPIFDKLLDDHNSYDFKLVKTSSGLAPSDHTSFYKKDIPVLGFFTGQHKDYHKPSDDEELINYEGLDRLVAYVSELCFELDKKDKLEFTKTKDESTETPDFKVTLGVMPDYLFDGKGMRIDAVKSDRPASNAGIKGGDIVTKMGHIEVKDMMSYMKALGEFSPGETIDVEVLRGKKKIVKKVTF